MANTGRLRTFYLSYLSSPAKDRLIYREISRRRVRKILELGIGVGQRAMRVIEAAARFSPRQEIRFTAVDLFEARTAADSPGVTLKMAHRLLSATGARIQLVPGDPHTGLSQIANALGQVDLVLISPRLNSAHLARAWFYVPRLLHGRSQVLIEQRLPHGGTSVRLLDRGEIQTLAGTAARRRAACPGRSSNASANHRRA